MRLKSNLSRRFRESGIGCSSNPSDATLEISTAQCFDGEFNCSRARISLLAGDEVPARHGEGPEYAGHHEVCVVEFARRLPGSERLDLHADEGSAFAASLLAKPVQVLPLTRRSPLESLVFKRTQVPL